MAADEHLGPQFFHGTGVHFNEGDIIRPANEVDPEMGGVDRASPAFAFAGDSVKGVISFVRDFPHGPAIYEVEPVGEFVSKLHSSGWQEHGAKEGWRVKRKVDEPEEGWMKAQAKHLREKS